MAGTASALRARVVLPSASIVALVACLLQAPGRIAPETKLDLAVDPIGFLGRVLHLWDPSAGFGQIQNQAAGYLFPMGPFFAIGKAAQIPMWAVQRAWMAALLVCAFWGTVKVAEALGIGVGSSRLASAAIYALSPPMVTLVGFTSGGQLGAALVPWALVPLIRASRHGSVRRAAARSGLAVTAMGAVNAASTLLVLPLPVLWLLTRARGSRRRSLCRWWVVAVALGCLWWVVPLLLQGRYGLNFVPYTESVGVTTATHSLVQVVRGTGYWLSSLFVNGPWLRAGWDMEHVPIAVLGSGLLAAIGIYGLARRDMPERTFLVVSAGLAVLLLGTSYGGALGGPFAGFARSMLEGPFAALRNLDKIEPVLRLPLALGAAHALSTFRLARLDRVTATGVVALMVLAGAAPFVRGHGVADGTFTRIPSYWQASARWLSEHGATSRTLVLPADAFGDYRWGRPLDEPLAPLARSPWAVRDLVPLGTPDLTHLLDAIEQRIDTAQPSPGLATALARMGVRYVLLRNDLNRVRSTSPPPAQLERALGQIPGLQLVASFGPTIDAGLITDRLRPDLASPRRVPALRIYEVRTQTTRAAAYPEAATLSVQGGSDAVLQLADRDTLSGRAVILAGDSPAALHGGQVVSDGLRLRDVHFGSVRNNSSYVLAAGELAPGTDRLPRDWVSRPADRTRAVMDGARAVTASSYASFFARLPEYQPANAFDGDPSTAWASGSPVSSVGEWTEIHLTHPFTATSVEVRLLGDHAWRPWAKVVRLTTDAGSVIHELRPTEAPQEMTLPNGPTRSLRLTILSVQGGFGSAGAGIRELALPGVRATRPLQVPRPPAGSGATTVLFDRSAADPYDATRSDEENRLLRRFTLGRDETVTVVGTAVPHAGDELDRLLASSSASPLKVTTSSSWASLPAFSAENLLDGDPRSAWLASPDDTHPIVNLSWSGLRRIDSLRLEVAPPPSLEPARIRLVSPDGDRDIDVAGSGVVHFDALTTDQVSVQFAESAGSTSAGFLTRPPVGLAELRFPALDDLRPPSADEASPIDVPCGAGPVVTIDGRELLTSLAGTRADLRALRPLALTVCGGDVGVGAGAHRLATEGTGAFRVSSLSLMPQPLAAAPGPARSVTIARWGSETRVARVGPGTAAILATTENFNAGWSADLAGRRLVAVRVDGWRQGWRVPMGAGGVVILHFRPGQTYRISLAVGAAAVLALIAIALMGRRRAFVDALAPSDPVELRGRFTAAAVVAVGFLVAGPIGAAAGLAIVTLSSASTAGLAGVAFAAATGVVAWHPGRLPGQDAGAYGPAAQALSALAVVALFASLLPTKSSASTDSE